MKVIENYLKEDREKFELLEMVLNEFSIDDVISKATDLSKKAEEQARKLSKGLSNSEVREKLDNYLEKTGEELKKGARKIEDEVNKELMKRKISRIINDPKTWLIATTVGVITLAFLTYKRFFSMKAKACAKELNRKTCLKKIKSQGAKAAIQALSRAKFGCSKSKNPEKCKINIDKQIAKWKKKAS